MALSRDRRKRIVKTKECIQRVSLMPISEMVMLHSRRFKPASISPKSRRGTHSSPRSFSEYLAEIVARVTSRQPFKILEHPPLRAQKSNWYLNSRHLKICARRASPPQLSHRFMPSMVFIKGSYPNPRALPLSGYRRRRFGCCGMYFKRGRHTNQPLNRGD